jgi:hypothetical protein
MHREIGRRIRRRGLGVGVVAASISTLAISAGTGTAASEAAPANTSPPSISGTPAEGKTLAGNLGVWTNNPTSYTYSWWRCNQTGNKCALISDATKRTYLLASADVGKTVRFRVVASNADGHTAAISAPTAVVSKSQASAPANSTLPSISGTAVEGRALGGNLGVWTNNPTRYTSSWWRCNQTGGKCVAISGAIQRTYRLGSADVGKTLRFRVVAWNAAGHTAAISAPTAVVQAAAPAPPPSRGNGCPAGAGNPDQVTSISPPARLLVDSLQSEPSVITKEVATITVRFHVTSTCGGPVQGALVYATATPYNQFSIPPEVPTGSDGWATLTFQRLSGFPTSRRQQLIAMFVRARKPGENLLVGISNRRLVSIRVDLSR